MKKKENFSRLVIFAIAAIMLLSAASVTLGKYEDDQGAEITGGPDAPGQGSVECPDMSMFCQLPYMPDEPWTGYSAVDVYYVPYDNFWGLTQPIATIHWWGANYYWYDPANYLFNIEFYTDNGGQPGTLVAGYYDITPTDIFDPGIQYSGFYNLYEYTYELDNPLTLSDGWIAISVDYYASGYQWWYWWGSDDGDMSAYQWYYYSGSMYPLSDDLAFALTYSWHIVMENPQYPDETGWDVRATYPAEVVDDWKCSESSYITDLHWWGSWWNDTEGDLNGFNIAIYDDIPADESPTGYSTPGDLLWEQYVPIDEITVTPISAPCGGGDGPYDWQICLEDTYGDGWDTAYIDVYVNGAPVYTGLTLSSGSGPECYPLTVYPGDLIDVYYTPGYWPSENIYYIEDQFGTQVVYMQPYYDGDLEDFEVPYYEPTGEGWYDPYCDEVMYPDHCTYYQYDLENISDPFLAWQGETYWIGISADVNNTDECNPPLWGWKTSLDHWNDDAVWGVTERRGSRGWTLLKTYDLPGTYPETWYEDTIDLSAYDGHMIKLAWRYTSDDEWGCYIDDVEVTDGVTTAFSENFDSYPNDQEFDGTANCGYWTQINNGTVCYSTYHTWHVDDYKYHSYPYSGNCLWNCPNDDWAVTPEIDLTGLSGSYLNFWYLWDDYWDIHFEVYVLDLGPTAPPWNELRDPNTNESLDMAFVVTGEPKGTVHNLNTGKWFMTIQSAIDDPTTLDGHVLEVQPPLEIVFPSGNYEENVDVYKELTIFNNTEGRQPLITVDGMQTGPCFTINADNVVIDGFNIINGTYGVYSQGTTGSTIENSWIHDNLNDGIYLANSDYNYMEYNYIHDNPGTGITLDTSNYNEITYNTFVDNNIGVLCMGNTGTNYINYNWFGEWCNAPKIAIENDDADVTVEAQYNWYGQDDGPGGLIADNVTSRIADGQGYTLMGNIHFDPWLGIDAEINVDHIAVLEGDVVHFDGSNSFHYDATGSPQDDVSYEWDLGDGTYQWLENFGHVYDTPGVYKVRLHASATDASLDKDNSVLDDFTTVYVTVSARGQPLQADADPEMIEGHSGNGYIGDVGEPIEFYGLATGGVPDYTFEWDFGDGTTAVGQTPIHAYSSKGVYTVTLTVTDSEGNSAVDTTTAVIGTHNEEPNGGVEIVSIKGGFGVKATINNTGNTTIDWEINVTGGFILMGGHATGTIPAETETTVSSGFMLGFGKVNIEVCAGDQCKSANGFLLGPFVLGVK